jgi:hypothetical protein
MGQTFSICCTCEQIDANAHCVSCADTNKLHNHENILATIKKHKKCMLKGQIMNGSSRSFAENLAKTLEIPEEPISNHYSLGKTIGLGQYGTVKEGYSLADPVSRVAVKILDLKGVAKTFKSI